MKGWKIAAWTAALILAAGIGASFAPAAHGQEKVARMQAKIVRVQAPRAVEILTGGSRIGVSIRDLEEADAKTVKGAATGVLVEDVGTDTPAEKAGIRKGDVIVEFDGERVRSARQLTRLVQETPAGRSVQAALIRDGQRTAVTLTPTARTRGGFDNLSEIEDWARDFRYRVLPGAPVPPARPVPPTPPAPPRARRFDVPFDGLFRTGNRLGIEVAALSSQLAEYFGAKEGALVTSVAADSAAAKAGIKAGDVITSIDGKTIADPADVRRAVLALDEGDEFTVAVMRDRKTVTLKGKAEWQERRRSTSRTIL